MNNQTKILQLALKLTNKKGFTVHAASKTQRLIYKYINVYTEYTSAGKHYGQQTLRGCQEIEQQINLDHTG